MQWCGRYFLSDLLRCVWLLIRAFQMRMGTFEWVQKCTWPQRRKQVWNYAIFTIFDCWLSLHATRNVSLVLMACMEIRSQWLWIKNHFRFRSHFSLTSLHSSILFKKYVIMRSTKTKVNVCIALPKNCFLFQHQKIDKHIMCVFELVCYLVGCGIPERVLHGVENLIDHIWRT